mmetsp:Transcript_20333/g.62870  ORF Transcript_20333/g.62870 Transcript_20333/m.62870 type:complete len:210 (+) Transcript_20333:124-753(+)
MNSRRRHHDDKSRREAGRNTRKMRVKRARSFFLEEGRGRPGEGGAVDVVGLEVVDEGLVVEDVLGDFLAAGDGDVVAGEEEVAPDGGGQRVEPFGLGEELQGLIVFDGGREGVFLDFAEVLVDADLRDLERAYALGRVLPQPVEHDFLQQFRPAELLRREVVEAPVHDPDVRHQQLMLRPKRFRDEHVLGPAPVVRLHGAGIHDRLGAP